MVYHCEDCLYALEPKSASKKYFVICERDLELKGRKYTKCIRFIKY